MSRDSRPSTGRAFNGGINVADFNIMSRDSRPSAGRAFNGGINVAFINVESYNMISQQRPEPAPRHTAFVFLISSLFNFLDLKYLVNGTASPFQTHPKTMWVAVSSSLLYCFAYAAELEPRFAQLGRTGMGLFGSILSVSLASVLFRNSVSFVLHSLCALFFNREMLCSAIELFRSWIRGRMAVPLVPVSPASTNRGGRLPV
ncbi:hypothetical protein RHSIM_Rhsim07G0112900 [Rhododendron simsii]|uniref:Uncharacterized protein n=1 Tax=Rhododendron simsii TaxID=118357 RepID=A0A834LIT8_RHOSS|nr:hypothetical protein RHSIM_Rhsim07G0112900 [Rhododendron simsii]